MAKVRKDVLRVGEYHLPDGRLFSVSHEDIVELAQRANAMARAGVCPPMCWEHQDEAKPSDPAKLLADKARLNLGFVESADVQGDTLYCDLDVPKKSDEEQLASVRYVSPEIGWDFQDGLGRQWPGQSILHLAVTARPVNPNQQPFAVAMGHNRKPVRLSMADFKKKDDEDEDGLSDSPGDALPADDSLVPPAPIDPAPADDAPLFDEPLMPVEEEVATEKPGIVPQVMEALAALDVPLPSDTTAENFMERLLTTATALVSVRAKQKMDETMKQVNNQTSGGSQMPNEANPPILMSLARKVIKMEREALQRRINLLETDKKITRKHRDKLLQELKTVRLSLTSAGEVNDRGLRTKVETLEDLEPSTARFGLGDVDLTRVREVDPPGEADTKRLREDARKEAERVSRKK